MTTRTEILKQYGITDAPELIVRAVQEGSLWGVGINPRATPLKTITPKRAAELSILLRKIEENELAGEISSAAQKAQQENDRKAA